MTGHSLGGGLAGLIAKLTGSTAYSFDNMLFELSAENANIARDARKQFGAAHILNPFQVTGLPALA